MSSAAHRVEVWFGVEGWSDHSYPFAPNRTGEEIPERELSYDFKFEALVVMGLERGV